MQIHRSAAALLAALALPLAPAAHAIEYSQVAATASRIDFSYKQMGVGMDGRFGKSDIQLAFDPARPEAGRASIEIDLVSINTGSAEANAEVAGKAWFDTARHPKAVFRSTSVKALGGNRFEAAGTLTIKGRSRDVVAPFSFAQQGADGVFDGNFVIRRNDFGIGEGEWADPSLVANEIVVKFHVQAAARK
ncbi:polyisoprenoid-binding protein [Azoarcus sp. DD4]|uniref:YceI family protein n=1 Tax=Azoarcus sp. DD4 TaxID=2027405 RepID=UPI00112B9326|nr:YceI family protein [Azoarcus sp. DD4]QDF98294.1 polyisoprenoid-binding protein [Azoarcus sp. DD4]